MLKKLASQTAIYGISGILARLINYLLVPLHTGAFETDSYGIISEFYALAAILNVIYTHGMETAYFRFASKKGSNPEVSYNTALTSVMCVSLLLSSLLIWYSVSIANALGYPEQSHFVVWFAIIIGVDAIVAIPFARLRQENKPVKFAMIKVGVVLVNIFLNVFFLYFCKGVFEGEILSDIPALLKWIEAVYDPNLGAGYPFFCNMIASLLAVPFLGSLLLKWRPNFSTKSFKTLWLYSFPLIFSGVAFAINETLDRELIKIWLPDNFYEGKSSLDAVGIYAACYKLSIFITLAVQGFRYAAEPFFFSKAEDKNSPELFAKVMRYFIITCTFMMVVVVANVSWISKIFLARPEYREGLVVVPLLLLANIFLGIYYNLSVWFKVTDRTYFGAFISSGGAIITLMLNFYLIPEAGYLGSAFATLACYSTMSLAAFLLGKKFYPIPYHVSSGLFYIILVCLISIISFQIQFSSFFLTFLVQNLLVLIFLSITFLIERKKIHSFKN